MKISMAVVRFFALVFVTGFLVMSGACPLSAKQPYIMVDNDDLGPYMKANIEERLYFRTHAAPPDGSIRVFSIFGNGYAILPQENFITNMNRWKHGKLLFGFYGYNIARVMPFSTAMPGPAGEIQDGYYLLTREIVFYTDPNDPERILETFDNPMTGKTSRVFHVQNDPVNTAYKLDGDKWLAKFPAAGTGVYSPVSQPLEKGNRYVYPADIIFSYPSFQMNLPGNTYHAAEIFDYWVQKTEKLKLALEKDLGSKSRIYNGTIDTGVSWTRFSHWLPWMCMSDAPVNGDASLTGGVLLHAHSEWLNSFEELPEFIKNEVRQSYPEYEFPPTSAYDAAGNLSANKTTWSAFKAIEMDANGFFSKEAWCAAGTNCWPTVQ